jgi:hypothetical protein
MTAPQLFKATLIALILGSMGSSLSLAQTPAPKETVVTTRATGRFDVNVTPLPADSADTGGFGRMALEKTFSGDITGTSRGQMLAAGTAVEGSGAYVALERITGTLQGRRGSFLLQHNGTMKAGAYEMRITVVPDSGTDELMGLAGTFTIIFEGKNHLYQFDYTLGS